MVLYSPLSSSTSIRLLILHPGVGEDELKASLVEDDLESPKQDYEALSYFWGPPVFPRKMLANGEHCNITQTLYDAFMRLRLSDRDRVIWADAICINPNSALEKNQQVRLMTRIYTQCSKGIIYLGPESDGSELVYDFLAYLVDWMNRDARLTDPAWKRGAISAHFSGWHQDLPADEDPRWSALRYFLRRPWFRRLWIIQEFALPKDIVTICGQWEMDGIFLPTIVIAITTVARFASIFMEDLDEASDREITTTLRLIHKHLNIRAALGRHWNLMGAELPDELVRGDLLQESLRLTRLVAWAFTCEVTDPRDRFFGLLSLANDVDDDPSLIPDYNKSLKEVQDAYYAFFIRQGTGSDLLARLAPPETLDASQPSWMERYDGDRHNNHVLSSAKLSQTVIQPEPDRSRAAVYQISNRDLAVRGFKIDQLSLVTTNCNDLGLEIFDEVLNLNITPSLSSEESFTRIILRVLSLNQTHLRIEPAPESFVEILEKYIDVVRGYKSFESILREPSRRGAVNGEEDLYHVIQALDHSRNMCFGVTQEGYYGMFPPIARDGDQVFIIDGTTKTFLVRYQPETDTYVWLGEVYVYDFEQQVQKSVKPDNLITLVVS